MGKGKIPVQRFEDYCKNKVSDAFGKVIPQMKGSYTFANVREIFPKVIGDSIEVGIRSFERQIQGYSDADTLLSGVESRTSSPVRIPRNEFFQIGDCNTPKNIAEATRAAHFAVLDLGRFA